MKYKSSTCSLCSLGICGATVKNIIRQNKKAAWQEFLFGLDRGDTYQALDAKIQNLQNQVNSLEDRIRTLENSKDALSPTWKASEGTKIIQQVKSERVENEELNTSSAASKSPLKTAERSEEYNIPNIPSNEEKALNEPNLITLGKIPEEEQIEIIKTGFQLKAEGKISLKKYYEGTDPDSLVQWKGYSIKYETIRRNKLYQQLKPSNN